MRYPTVEMPKKLAESAFHLFAEKGINGITMEEIAAQAKVTKGSLYWHYRSKQEITEAAAAHYYQAWYRNVNGLLARGGTPWQRLERVVRFSVRSCLLDAGNRVFTLELLTYSLHDHAVRKSWAQFYAGAREFYIALVDAARSEGQVRTDDSRQAVDMMLAAMEGIKQRALFEPHICTPSGEESITAALLKLLDEF